MEQPVYVRYKWWIFGVAALCIVIIASVLLLHKEPQPAPSKPDAKATPKATEKPAPKPAEPHRYVALYGTPNAPSMGALGSYAPQAAVEQAKKIAAEYQPFSQEPIQPTFEIITTIASSTPTANGDYSRELDIAELQPWVDAAQKAGVYVVLDLQPGRTDFLTQAKQYEPLLKLPNVGLALDPEWRLYGDQQPLAQIGSVSAAEVNETSAWLSELVQQYDLPPKVFLLHQFRMSMLADRSAITANRPELITMIQMDGQGAQHVKQDTWRAITANPPAGVLFGWKNFYHKDPVVLTPEQTMAITPKPWFVSYQ